MAIESEKKLNTLEDLITHFRDNVFNKVISGIKPFADHEYNECVLQINNIKNAVCDIIKEETTTAKSNDTAKKILNICDCIIKRLKDNSGPIELIDKEEYVIKSEHASEERKNVRDPNGSKGTNPLSSENDSQEDEGFDMDQNESKIYEKLLQDILKQIKDEREAINDYRQRIPIAENYNQRKRCEIDLKNHEKTQAEYFEKYSKLKTEYAHKQGEVISINEIKNLEKKIDSLKMDFIAELKDTRTDFHTTMETTLEMILQRFDESDKKIIGNLSELIDGSKTKIINNILKALDDDRINDPSILKLANYIKTDLANINTEEAENPTLARKVFALTEQSKDEKSEIEVKHLLKLSIPIIPGIFKYETSLGLKGTKNLRKVWNTLVKNFGLKEGT